MGKSWLPLEANPEVLTSYAYQLGLPPIWRFHDVLGVEPWAIEMIPQPVKAVLLLFPISEKSEEERLETTPSSVPDILYMKQTIGNACGTIAVLHALSNLAANQGSGFEDTSYIRRFVEMTRSLSPADRGEWLENDSEIERAHIAIESRGQSSAPDREEEVDTHFIAFVLAQDGRTVVELDGRREGPIVRGMVDSEEHFGTAVLEVIKREFMDRNPEDIRFSILALAPGIE